MKIHSNRKGFTLIELLVVIAIIGILSSVVLASLNTARGKSQNSKTKAQLASLRSAAEAYYDTNGGNYNGLAGNVTGDCSTADSMFVDIASNMSVLTSPSSYPGNPTLTCYSDGISYAVSVPLFQADGAFDTWCVDSKGTSMGRTGAINSPSC